MALQLAFEKDPTGESYPEAYHRVLAVNINVAAGGTEIVFGVYRDAAARTAGKEPVVQSTYAATGADNTELFSDAALANTTPIISAYTLLKRLPQYTGAIDV